MPYVYLALAALCLIIFGPGFAAAQTASAEPEPNRLKAVTLNQVDGFSRLSFSFTQPLPSYLVRRDDVNRVLVDFGALAESPLPQTPFDALVSQVELAFVQGRLVATVSLAVNRYEMRHFASDDGLACVLDFRLLEDSSAALAADSPILQPLLLPSLPEVAERLSLMSPPAAGDDQARNLANRALAHLRAGSNDKALEDINYFLERFPKHPAAPELSFLKTELDFLAGDPLQNAAAAIESWSKLADQWPQSVMLPRAQFLSAEADRLAGHHNEAAAKFKLLATDSPSPDDIYTQLALLRAADLMISMGLVDQAAELLEPVVQKGLSDRLSLEAYARLGMVDFYQGFFSQANEVFRDALELAPQLYASYPEMLYAAGEGYHYLQRPDLSRLFLMHALNLMPDHPKADVIMARIGDSYRQEGRDLEAMAIYGAAKKRFPDGDGGLISQVRLAEMGALHSFFTQERVFDILERGSRDATVRMYKEIVDTGSSSPLIQLAQLKIGSALAEEGENGEAIKWLKDIEMYNPQSSLLPEALPALNKALVDEFKLRNELRDYQALADLYADNSSYILDEDRPQVLRLVAEAHEKLGNFDQAKDIWRELEEQSPEKRLERAQALVLNSLKVGQNLEALRYLSEMEKEFPQHSEWINERLEEVEKELARPRNALATENLMDLREAVSGEPARRNALVDAIEIEINDQRYEKASALMDEFRRHYPDDPLSPEYLLTQARIEDYNQRYDNSWDLLSDFRLSYPDDPRLSELMLSQIERAKELERPDDVFRFTELYRGRFPEGTASEALLRDKIDELWSLGRYEESQAAADEFRRAYPQSSTLADVIIDQAQRHWEAGLYEQAAALTDELMRSHPSDPRTLEHLINMARNDWSSGRYEPARELAEKMLLNYPDDPRTPGYLIELSQRNWDNQRYEPAQAALEDLLRYYPQLPQTGDAILERANADWGLGRHAEARANWELFRQNYPEDPRLAATYLDEYKKAMAEGQSEAAFEAAEALLNSGTGEPALRAELLLEEAKDYLALGRPDEALAAWERFRVEFPQDARNPQLLLLQARQELKMGRRQPALEHYREFLGSYPDHELTPDVYLETAAAETQAGRPQDAWEHLDRYRLLFPRHSGRARALLDQAELGRQLGRLDEAIKLYPLFRRDYPNAQALAATFLAQARLEIAAGQPLAAIDTLEEGLQSAPELDLDPEVQALLTDLYLESGRIEAWAAIVEKNLNRGPAGPENLSDRFLKYNQLAQVYQELGQPENAERNYDAALANRPPDASAETLYAVATAYKNLLRPEKYLSTLALVRDSGDPFWQKIASDELAQESGAAPAS